MGTHKRMENKDVACACQVDALVARRVSLGEFAMIIEPDISVFRPDRPGIRKVLGDLEAEIMEIIWARPSNKGTTVRDVFEILHDRRRLAYTSVMSTMTRLAKKKLLRTEKRDQAYVYYPNFTEEEFIRCFVGR